jgi:hypothetical protein
MPCAVSADRAMHQPASQMTPACTHDDDVAWPSRGGDEGQRRVGLWGLDHHREVARRSAERGRECLVRQHGCGGALLNSGEIDHYVGVRQMPAAAATMTGQAQRPRPDSH